MSFEKDIASPVPPMKGVSEQRFSPVRRGKMPKDGLGQNGEGNVPAVPVADSTVPRKGGDHLRPEIPAGGNIPMPTPRMSTPFSATDPTR
jgi:hypothetical protein